MSDNFTTIAELVNVRVLENTKQGGAWGPGSIDFQVPIYNADPAGDKAWLGDSDDLFVLGRYGNWTGAAYGGGHLSPKFEFGSYNLSDPAQFLKFQVDFAHFRPGGQFWENPGVGYRDEFDRLARVHDLLYQDANIEAAQDYLDAAKAFHEHRITAAQLGEAKLAAEHEEERNNREADLWFLKYGENVIPSHAYGVVLKHVGDTAFELMADAYYVQHLEIPTREILVAVGQRYGSRLGVLIGGDNPFAATVGGTLGHYVGAELADWFQGADKADIGASLLAALGGEVPIVTIFDRALASPGQEGSASIIDVRAAASLLLTAIAENLGLSEADQRTFTRAGLTIGDYIASVIASPQVDDIGDFLSAVGQDFDFTAIGNFLIDIALDFVTNDFVGEMMDKLRSIVEIDSTGEFFFAELGSFIGSIIGSEFGPIGAALANTVGYILGSIVFEVLDFFSFGLLEDLFDLFGDDPRPQSWYYVGLDAVTGDLEMIGHVWKKDGIDTDDILKIYDSNRKLNDAFMTFVNGVTDSIGGTVDGSFFYPITLDHGGLDPAIDFRNHAMIGFDKDKFIVKTYWGGDLAIFKSNSPEEVISHAIAYELAHLIFYGGDLAQIRALNIWEASLFGELLTPLLPPGLPDIFSGLFDVPDRPQNPNLDLLAADLQIAKDYRFYLDNSEAINFLMAQAPNSPFAAGWLATLSRAAELGLNAPYVGSPHGGAGTAAGESILSADGNDLLFGNGGDDVLKLYGGDDTAYGGTGNDTIAGGFGRDLLLGDDGNDLIEGGHDDDRLFGGSGNDVVAGQAGKDEMAGEGGDDTLDGGLGDDVLFGDIPGAAGRDTISGGDGDDLARGGAGDDRIAGDAGTDRLYGDDGADEVEGGEGNDRIEGGAGNDRLDGGAGIDRILGDNGDDLIAGGTGDDLLYGLAGTDTVAGGGGRDRLFGDEGNDLLAGGDDDDEAGGWKGDDRLEGDGGNDRLAGQDGSDVLLGGDGNDILYGDRAPDSGPLAHSEAEIIASARARLGAGDFAIIYQGPGYSYDALRAADHDLIVINPAKSAITGALNSEQLWTAGEVAGIEAGGKVLLAYLNVAKINDFNNYWNPAWTKGGGADDLLAAGAPDFLAGEDAGFDHTRLVDFWEDGWRDLLTERIATIVEQGFSGIFLDDILEYFVRRGDSLTDIAQAARDMRDLVTDLVATARILVAAHSGAASAEGFLIVVNGAPFLIQDTTADGSAADAAANAAFYASLDGFLAENYFSQGLGYAIDEAVAEFGARGIALLSVDTDIVTEEQRIGIERAAVNAGFLPEVVPDALFASSTERFRSGFGDVATPGDDLLEGGSGNDTLYGGTGSDTASYAGAGAAVTVTLRLPGTAQATAGAGLDALFDIENLTGSAFGDSLIGNDLANVLNGLGGADTMRGSWGDDTYYVDNVGDVVEELAGQGVDTIYTSLAAYSLIGTQIERLGSASDTAHDLRGNSGNNVITGGGGADVLRLYDGGIDNVNGGGGNDNIFFIGSLTSADIVNGGDGVDTLVLQGPYGALTLTANVTQIENISILGGGNTNFGEPGTNRYDYVLTTNDANFAAGVQARINGSALLAGEDFTFDGTAETNASFVVYGGRGKDTLTGGLGNDIFFLAEERFSSGDVVNGGSGYDGMFLRGNYTIDFNAPGYTGLFTSIENLTLTSATDERYARGGGTEFDYNLILSNAIVNAGAVLTVSGTILLATETMILDGSQETDGMLRLFGGKAGDTLKGGAQNDLLHGNLGADTLAGGGGADTFRYDSIAESSSASRDHILDFTPGTDKIDLSRIDARTNLAGDQAFIWIGSTAFSGNTAQLRAFEQGGSWFLQGDVNGDGVADLVIQLTLQGPTPLGTGDFLL